MQVIDAKTRIYNVPQTYLDTLEAGARVSVTVNLSIPPVCLQSVAEQPRMVETLKWTLEPDEIILC